MTFFVALQQHFGHAKPPFNVSRPEFMFGILERWNNNQVTPSLSKPHELSYRSNIINIIKIISFKLKKEYNEIS